MDNKSEKKSHKDITAVFYLAQKKAENSTNYRAVSRQVHSVCRVSLQWVSSVNNLVWNVEKKGWFHWAKIWKKTFLKLSNVFKNIWINLEPHLTI